jgi:Domain of unknown function (DUF1918)
LLRAERPRLPTKAVRDLWPSNEVTWYPSRRLPVVCTIELCKGKEKRVKAKVGDWLVIKGTTIEQPDQRGLITEVHSQDGAPPYVVRWLATDHETTVFPGPDAVIVTAAEQTDADKRARRRFGAVQSAISHKSN